MIPSFSCFSEEQLNLALNHSLLQGLLLFFGSSDSSDAKWEKTKIYIFQIVNYSGGKWPCEYKWHGKTFDAIEFFDHWLIVIQTKSCSDLYSTLDGKYLLSNDFQSSNDFHLIKNLNYRPLINEIIKIFIRNPFMMSSYISKK